VSHTHFLQFVIIMATMALAFALVLARLPHGLSFPDAWRLAGSLGKLNAVDTTFDLNSRYNLWSGLIGGFFLQLSYFGADQSQVGRYLTGQSVAHSRLGLLFNAAFKVPMQFFILLLGVMVFVLHLFVVTPAFFNPAEVRKVQAGPLAGEYRAVEARHRSAAEARRAGAEEFARAAAAGDAAARAAAEQALREADRRVRAAREEAVGVIRRADPGANAGDTNYIFLHFVLASLPAGVVGLVLAAIFAASMNSTSAELNALTSTTVVDVWRRLPGSHGGERHQVTVSRVATVVWAAFAVGFAEYASRMGSLIEAVNILGSLFYGTILGVFMTAFLLRRVGGTAVFVAALVAEAAVLACFRFSGMSFLWYNVVGCVVVMAVGLALSPVFPGRKTT
jgi:Na+/proline symporter